MLIPQVRAVHGYVLDMPVVMHVKVVDIPFRGAAAVSLGPFVQTTEIPQLQSIDDVFDVSLVQVQQTPGPVCEKTVAIPQLHLVFFPGQGCSQCLDVQLQCRLVQTFESCAGLQLQFERGRCPCYAGAQRCCRCSSCG